MINLSVLFGPQYDGAISETIGEFVCGKSPVSVVTDRPPKELLPSGGYIITYLSGSFLLINRLPSIYVVGGNDGMSIRWRAIGAPSWTSSQYPVTGQFAQEGDVIYSKSADIKRLWYLEFTRPHRLQLVPPSDSIGSVKVKITRYVPSFMSMASDSL